MLDFIAERREGVVLQSLRRISIAAIALSLGCATVPTQEVGPLLSEARQDEVRAHAKYQGQYVRVSGVVANKGIEHFTHVVGSGYGFGYGPVAGFTARDEDVPYPFVVLRDASDPGADRLKCYFSPDELEIVDGIRPGQKLVLQGDFYRLMRGPGWVVMLLGGCRVASWVAPQD